MTIRRMLKLGRTGALLAAALAAGWTPMPAGAQASPSTHPATQPAEKVVRLTAQHPDTGQELVCLVDVTAAPDVEQWGTDAGKYALKWYPTIEKILASENFTPTRQFRLLFKDMDGVAHASGNVITISTRWIKRYPDDFGMVAHELTHVIQQYRRGEGWLTEGIADYVRYYVVEPGSKRAWFDINKASYKNAYQPAAGFLDYLERTKGPGIVSKLNVALRQRRYSPEAFANIAGGTPDELWEEFKQSRQKPAKDAKPPKDPKPQDARTKEALTDENTLPKK